RADPRFHLGGMRWKNRNASKKSDENRRVKKKSKPTLRSSRPARNTKKTSTSWSMKSTTYSKKTLKNSSRITCKKGESNVLSLMQHFPASPAPTAPSQSQGSYRTRLTKMVRAYSIRL